MAAYEFSFTTGKIEIDYDRCRECRSYACVKACSLFGRAILRIEDDKPALVSADAGKQCTEDLSCELYCRKFGNRGLKITLDMFGLEEYRRRQGGK